MIANPSHFAVQSVLLFSDEGRVDDKEIELSMKFRRNVRRRIEIIKYEPCGENVKKKNMQKPNLFFFGKTKEGHHV